MDEALRPHLKETLYLPTTSANDYLYGSTNAGACGIPLAAEDSDLFLIDNAFKLITSKDVGVAELALRDLRVTGQNRQSPRQRRDGRLSLWGQRGDLQEGGSQVQKHSDELLPPGT